MPQDYIPRRSSSSQRQAPRRVSSSSSASVRRQQPVHRGRPPRRKSGPPLFPILVLAVVLILAVVIIVLVSRSCSSSEEPAGNNSSAVSTVSGTETSGLTSTASGATDPAATPAPTPSAEPTPAPQEEPQVAPETVGGLLVVEDTAYEYYNFVTDLAKEYITAVVNAGSKLAGKATVYDMVIPTSIDIMLPESYIEKNSLNTSDQKKAIDEYILPSITAQDPNIKTISIFDTLKAHANEYLYFRTDHHWTQLGAYYGYVEFCKARGFEPVALDQFDRADYTGYLGSFYTATNSAALAANPRHRGGLYPPGGREPELYPDRRPDRGELAPHRRRGAVRHHQQVHRLLRRRPALRGDREQRHGRGPLHRGGEGELRQLLPSLPGKPLQDRLRGGLPQL